MKNLNMLLAADMDTVDELVEYCRSTEGRDKDDNSACYMVVTYYPKILLEILKSKANKDSVFDLMLIHEISKYTYTDKLDMYTSMKNNHLKILEIYRSRDNGNRDKNN